MVFTPSVILPPINHPAPLDAGTLTVHANCNSQQADRRVRHGHISGIVSPLREYLDALAADRLHQGISKH